MVTVLFCDLVGFTPLSEKLDVEEVRSIQDEYFGRMSAEIHRYGGIVEKYAGDAVLAIFGAPAAHEDDPERAVRCALAMHQALQPLTERALQCWDVRLSLRIGVNTGEVVSGVREAEGRSDYAVTGDAVNTAARLQSAAEPGGIVAGAETMRLAQRSVLFGERQELVLKGKSAAVPAYSVLGLRDQLAERWETGRPQTLFVGRERELAVFLDAWEQARQGERRLVTLVAEAGAGKSRLLAEALDLMQASEAVRVVRGRCLSYTEGTSFWLLAGLLRSLCGLREQDSAPDIRAHLRRTIDRLLDQEDQTTRAEALDVLGEVLGLEAGISIIAQADARIRRQVLLRSLRLVFAAQCAREPTIVTLEDLHWVDAASRDVLIEVLEAADGPGFLVIAAHRPEWEGPWQEWPWASALQLPPLEEQDVQRLARSMLDVALAPVLERKVLERAGGNPFFLEELVRSLQEADALEERDGELHLRPQVDEQLPSTVTELLLARLDRLDRSARRVAQVGSVIGRSFAVRLVAHALDVDERDLQAPLGVLEQADLALPRGGAELEYTFKHVTVQEVAYRTILLRRRQELHGSTARALIRLNPDDEPVEAIAYHYARTPEWLEAARWLERAGDRARRIYANEAAATYYQQAHERLLRVAGESVDLGCLLVKLGAVLEQQARYEEALEALHRADTLYAEARDRNGESKVAAQLGRLHASMGNPEAGIAVLEPTIAALTESGPSRALVDLLAALGRLLFFCGRHQESLAEWARAVKVARAMHDSGALIQAESGWGSILSVMHRHEEAQRVLTNILPLIEASQDLETLLLVLANLGQDCHDAGDFARGKAYSERALALSVRMADPFRAAWQTAALVNWLYLLGEWDEARARGEQILASTQHLGTSWYTVYPLLELGRLSLGQGRLEEASAQLEECVLRAKEARYAQVLQGAHALLAERDLLLGDARAARARLEPLLDDHHADPPDHREALVLAMAHLDLGDVEQARAAALAAEAWARQTGSRLTLVEALRVHGMTAARERRWEEARQAFWEGVALARALPYPYEEARILYEEGVMHRQSGDAKRSAERLEKSAQIFRALGASLWTERAMGALQTCIAP